MKRKKIADRNNMAGITLIELFLAISIMGIIVISIGKVMGISLVSIAKITDKEEVLADARHVMESITMFVRETDDITSPVIGDDPNTTNLRVVERVLDTYDNATHAFIKNGDGILDADNDSNGTANDDLDGGDPIEYVEFDLDGSILSIKYPDYSTADLTDDTAYETLCEDVTLFECDRLEDNLVEIRLTLNTGNNEVALKTRVFAINYGIEGILGGGGEEEGGGADDFTNPVPDPMTWETPPTSTSSSSITMTASNATDPSGVEYFFECTAGGGNDSGWQDSVTYEDTGLTPYTIYTYKVQARDKSLNHNETSFSNEASGTTDPIAEIHIHDIEMSLVWGGGSFYGKARVWIKDEDNNDVEGALVVGDWSGCDGEIGDSDDTNFFGKAYIQSQVKRINCDWNFEVKGVEKAGYLFDLDSESNSETQDSIRAEW